jgi:hypothetical protein
VRPTGIVDPQVEVRATRNQIDDLMREVRLRVERDERVLVTTLTKKMAEDLSSYLLELGFRARYLHSEIDTLERIQIIRALRLGEYDVLVGVNLLREGLDLPEVSLVAILDADKEGFLRGETSLIQTIGRAARNIEGTVLMYADRVTDSMRYGRARGDRPPPRDPARLQRGARDHGGDDRQGRQRHLRLPHRRVQDAERRAAPPCATRAPRSSRRTSSTSSPSSSRRRCCSPHRSCASSTPRAARRAARAAPLVKCSGPHHLVTSSGSVQTCHTSSRGASRRRSITIVCSPIVDCSAIAVCLSLDFAEVMRKAIQPALPDVAVLLEPVRGLAQRCTFEAGRTQLGGAPARDEPRPLEHLEVPRDRLDTEREGLGELVHSDLTVLGEPREDRATRRVGKGRKRGAELVGRHNVFTQMVYKPSG